MIKIYPFRAVTPSAEDAAAVASEPYDVINTAEARERAAGNAKSYLHVVRSEIDLPEGTDAYDPRVYATAKANLDRMLEQGLLIEADEPTIFIYRQVYQGRAQYGVVCCCDADQYRANTIKKHEKTRPDKEDDRTRHMTVCSAHAEPVFLTFHDTQRLTDLIQSDSAAGRALLFDFTATDGVQHTGWRVSNAAAYVSAFEEVESLYIADGHHRTAGGERAATQRQQENPNHTGDEQYNRILAVVFPASQLRVLPYNRVVKDLNGLPAADFLDRLRQVGSVGLTDDPRPPCAGNVCVFVSGRWYRFTFPNDTIAHDDPIHSLDVALLQARVLDPILGIGDPRTDDRIGFVGGIRGPQELERLVNDESMAVAFSMHPTSIQQLLDVADAGEIMPPKSTWFEPKLRSGLFVHRFESYDAS